MLLLSAVLLGAGVQALRFDGPRATPLAFDIQAPADFPTALPTSPPQANAELLRRAAAGTTLFFAPDNTCGYLTGASDIAYTCNNAEAQCAISTPSANTGYIGCCTSGNCAGYHVDCVDSSAYSSSSACGASCRADTMTLKCTESGLPFCNSVSINGGNLKVYGYYCNNEAISTMQALYTTYDGETDGRAFTLSVVTATTSAGETASFGGGGSPESVSATPTGPPTSPSPSSGGSSDNSDNSDNGDNDDNGGSKSNTGAIVGGVVGGVVGLALIGAVIFFLMRRHRKNAGKQPPQLGSVGAVGGSPAPGNPGPGYGMSQVAPPPPPPPPAGGYYTPGTAPNQPGYYHQQPGAPPQQYYTAAAVPGIVSPDRADSTSPLKPDYTGSGAGSPQPGQDYRLSSVSAVATTNTNTNTNGQYTGPISPQTTGPTTAQTAVASPVGSPQVPVTIHEAAGNAVGTPDYNANHHGEMVELA